MKARSKSNGFRRGDWRSRAREAKPECGSVRQTGLMLTSTAIAAADRQPVGCAVLVIVLLSLLLWAILLILLWRLFVTEGLSDIQENIKCGFVTRSCISAIHSVRGIAAAGFNRLRRTGKAWLIVTSAQRCAISRRVIEVHWKRATTEAVARRVACNCYRLGIKVQCAGGDGDARYLVGRSWDARANHPDDWACCSVGVEHEASRYSARRR